MRRSLIVALLMAGCAAMPQAFSERNGILASADGRTLYVFAKDAPGKSNCNGTCAQQWPPFIVRDGGAAGGAFAIITRDDGARQWAREGQPLYFFAGDTAPGETKGDGLGGAWSVVKVTAQTGIPARSSDGGY